MFNKIKKIFFAMVLIGAFLVVSSFSTPFSFKVNAMPYYSLKPEKLVLRAEFYTTYTTSSKERKNNIEKAVDAINGTFLDVNGEFSFNKTVGERTVRRGYQTSKIIVNGRFVDGVGGGVCQVSTTLYNALLLSGIKIIEYHPHSLPVSYVAPSFDAMVNSGSADLRAVNNTNNPIIIYGKADGSRLKFSIYGQPMQEKYLRKSIIKEEIPTPPPIEEIDVNGEYPDLYEGERKIVSYGRKGIISQGVLVKTINGRVEKEIFIRNDKYNPVQGVEIIGTAIKEQSLLPNERILEKQILQQSLQNLKKNFDKRINLC